MGSLLTKSNGASTERPSDEEFPDLLHLLESKKDSDIILRCSNKTFNVHSKILEAHSDTFKAIFDSVPRNQEVSILDISPVILQHMLHYLYSGTLEKITVHYALKLLEAAKLYEIHPLQKKCLQLIKTGMKEEYVCDILTYSHSRRIGELKDIVIAYLVTNKKFLLSETWRMFSEKNTELANDVLVAFVRNTI